MRTTPRALVVIAAVALGSLAACSSSDGGSEAASSSSTEGTDATTTTEASSSEGGELLVVNATGGSLAEGTLELTGVDGDVTVFADRPARTSSEQPLSSVADEWASLGFEDDPPNAALVTRSEGGQTTTVLELGTPEVSGDTVTFPVTQVASGEAEGVVAALPSEAPAGELTEPSLFIDSGATGSLVAVTISGTWGSGLSKVELDDWFFSSEGGTWMGFEMGEPGTITFDAYDGVMSLTAAEPLTGTFAGVGLMDAPTALLGQAVLADGSDLTIGLCGSNGTSGPLEAGQFDLPLPNGC